MHMYVVFLDWVPRFSRKIKQVEEMHTLLDFNTWIQDVIKECAEISKSNGAQKDDWEFPIRDFHRFILTRRGDDVCCEMFLTPFTRLENVQTYNGQCEWGRFGCMLAEMVQRHRNTNDPFKIEVIGTIASQMEQFVDKIYSGPQNLLWSLLLAAISTTFDDLDCFYRCFTNI